MSDDDPLWKTLAEAIRIQDPKRQHLEHLRERFRGASGNDIAAELLGEMASSLGKAERKINNALAELAHLGQTIDALEARRSPKHRAEILAKIDEFNAVRQRAEQAVWELRVQREAIGFRGNRDLASLYPIPPRR